MALARLVARIPRTDLDDERPIPGQVLEYVEDHARAMAELSAQFAALGDAAEQMNAALETIEYLALVGRRPVSIDAGGASAGSPDYRARIAATPVTALDVRIVRRARVHSIARDGIAPLSDLLIAETGPDGAPRWSGPLVRRDAVRARLPD